MADMSFSADGLVVRAMRALSLEWSRNAPAHRGDFDLNADWTAVPDPKTLRPAAVLVPVLNRGADETSLILTRRAEHLSAHAGQVAFPGGKIEADDANPVDAALREAREEIGLDPARVSPLGYLDPYVTTSGFRIHPVVALVARGPDLTPDPSEVDEVFDVPLRFLMQPDNHRVHAREWRGALRHYYVMPYGRHYIWGVTAGIVRLMYERLYLE